MSQSRDVKPLKVVRLWWKCCSRKINLVVCANGLEQRRDRVWQFSVLGGFFDIQSSEIRAGLKGNGKKRKKKMVVPVGLRERGRKLKERLHISRRREVFSRDPLTPLPSSERTS